ncbi:MFS transporter [Sulfurospirillum arcachonense]|uniref:MFS transporter n=1 Tax=Sulfurospirillum arcachonense TaxID=57666 RepID=UPI000468C615|nr:MFS transporter [Sulfurospirillum arcachonense]
MLKTIMPLNLIISLRFFGLFIVLPVLSVYALSLKGANELLIGIAIGGYALTQMLLQVPFGMLSDKIGRKITITIGLVIFIIGSLICAFSTDIYMLILGRLLQGAGAIGAVAVAMISDMIKEEIRAKAMAIMGGSIALTFALSMVLGPLISGYWGIDKLFFITAACAFLAIFVLYIKVPNPPKITHDYENNTKDIIKILKDKNLIKMNITNMLQKGMMTLAFLTIPIMMVREFGYLKTELWQVYMPAMVFGIFAMGFSAVMGEKKKKPKEVLIIGIIFFGLAFSIMGYTHSAAVFITGVVVFFIGFNVHEPLLQSLASKYAKVHQKGAALGVFNSFGHFGTFTGALWGGHYLKWYGIESIALVVIITCILWVFLIISLENPVFTKNIYIPFNEFIEEKLQVLNNTNGVIEWYKNENEKVLIIKYNSKNIQEESILPLIK